MQLLRQVVLDAHPADDVQLGFQPINVPSSDETAKLIIYHAFVEGDLQAPKHLAGRVHQLYFNPQFEEFAPRTMWSLGNAFTSTFKELDPIPQFKATAKLAPFLEGVQSLPA